FCRFLVEKEPMRTHLMFLILGLAGGLFLDRSAARAQTPAPMQISAVADFYTPLATYGTWVDVPSYGRCWRPTQVGADWRPYAEGQWVWTDVGWYWDSTEPWAWACYHYGSWIEDPTFGWVWVPGTEWAPAWVMWREGPDYIGWAPWGPEIVVVPAVWFVFVDVHHFHD